jgi:hypothetical protein
MFDFRSNLFETLKWHAPYSGDTIRKEHQLDLYPVDPCAVSIHRVFRAPLRVGAVVLRYVPPNLSSNNLYSTPAAGALERKSSLL